ncbi:MAG: 3-hydroxyanthranilate 3,4-dioxygenase [Chloroflexota bacterium]
MPELNATNLAQWIEDNRASLKPPVGNKLLYGQDSEFQVMIVAGPNVRTDYHCEPGEELFYQLKGDITLKVIEDGVSRDIPIREGEIFLLPGNTIHSPRRPAGTMGMVVERQRREDEEESVTWYCDNCGTQLYQFVGVITDLGTQLKPVMEHFFGDESLRTCSACGTVHPLPAPATA